MAEQMNASLSKLESTLEEYLVKKAPYQLPADVKEGIVKFGPWIILIFYCVSNFFSIKFFLNFLNNFLI